jgi:hypothetical protein
LLDLLFALEKGEWMCRSAMYLIALADMSNIQPVFRISKFQERLWSSAIPPFLVALSVQQKDKNPLEISKVRR